MIQGLLKHAVYENKRNNTKEATRITWNKPKFTPGKAK